MPPQANERAAIQHTGHRAVDTAVPALVSAAMLVAAAILSWPYGYFQILRLVTCASAVWLAVCSQRSEHRGWMWAMAGTAVLFNPLIPVTLTRPQWRRLDLAAAVVFLACLGALSAGRSIRIGTKLRRRAAVALAVIAIVASSYGAVYAAAHRSRVTYSRRR